MRKILCVVAMVAVVVGLWASPAAAKSFSIDKMTVEAVMNADASMDVHEHLTYTFDGEFHNGTRPIPGGSYTIVDMKVTENGQTLPFDGAPNDLVWHFSALNETRTFDISYRVLNVTKVGADVGELYWKFMGNDHPSIGSVDVTLRTPNADQLRAWAHGPLNGHITISGSTVDFNVSPLPANQFLEGRVALPASNFTAVASDGGERLPQILAEEKVNADDANAERGFTAPAEPKKYPVLFNILAVVVGLTGVGAHVLIWRKWGREPKRPQDIGNYWYDAPDEPPATVVATIGGGDAFAGTLVDLAQRGYLTIEEVEDKSGLMNKIFGAKQDWLLTKKRAIDGDLKNFESRMLFYLFEDGDQVTQSDLHDKAKRHPSSAKEFLTSFNSEVTASADGTYWATGTGGAKALNILVVVALAAFGFLCISQTALVGGALFAVAVVIAILTKNMSRRTDLGARKAAEWEGLKHYLKDFSNFKDAPIGHLILWERYLVYGVAFGVAAELAKGFEMRMPDIQNSNVPFAAWYVGTGGMNDFGRIAAISAFSSGVQSAMSPPFQSSSSSGFGGGGFSGGGGGGGGGGGAGAN